MSVATRPPAKGGRRPDRLPRSESTASRGSEIRVGLLGALGLLVLVVGVPLVLILFVGYPLPRSAPSRDWLTTSISATLIINVLAFVVWLVWAHFTVCLLTEWRAIRRGRLPSHVAMGGGSQLLARRLVAAALLLSGAATAFAHSGAGASGSATPRPPAAVASQQAGTAAQTPDATTAPDAAATHADSGVAEHRAAAGQTKYYTVQPPHGRRYDSLWDIADRTLNDPMRYKEIFALNHDRVQADGRKLVDANLIMPGWQLRLPADASGPGVHATHASTPPVAVPARGDTGADPAGATVAGSSVADHAAASDVAAGDRVGAHAAGTHATAPDGRSLETELFGGALMLAGIALALSARRGPYAEPSKQEDEFAGVADAELANGLDRALRTLSAGRTAQGRILPQPIVAWASETEVTLTMASGDVADPPAPWRASTDGRSWQVQLAAVTAADVAAPYPALVSVGRARGHELFVDLEQAPGLIALGGDAERARALATAIAVQASTCAWSDGNRVTLVGFGDGEEIAQLAPASIGQTPQLAAVLDGVEAEHRNAAALRRQLGVDGVLTGRQARRSPSWRPHLLILSGPPTPEEAARLTALVGDGRSQFVALTVGDAAGARWRFTLNPDGEVDLGALGVSATAHQLSHAGIARLVALAAEATKGRLAQSPQVRATSPRSAALATAPARERRVAATPRAEVTLLGPVAVSAAGPVHEAKLELMSSLVVAVALAPGGLHEAILRTSVWPRGVTDDVFSATVADVVSWLGTDSAARPALREENGRWLLGDTVPVDWDELRQLASGASGAGELPQLMKALGLVRGEAFSGTASGSQSWLAFRRAAREARLVGTAVARRAAELNVAAGAEDAAEQALRTGLVLVPAAEPLWRDLLALVSKRGPEPATAVATEMYETLARLRIWPEPETDALVAQVAPDYRSPEPTRPGVVAAG